MTDIFLYPGEANPNDVKLSDPTAPRTVALNCSLAVTEAQDVAVMAASVRVTGSLSVTESQDAPTMTASVKISGSLAVAEVQDVAAFVAAARINGSLAVTEQQDIPALAANVCVSAALAVTENQDIAQMIVSHEAERPPVLAYGGGLGRFWKKIEIPPSLFLPVREVVLKVKEEPDRVEMTAYVSARMKPVSFPVRQIVLKSKEEPDRVEMTASASIGTRLTLNERPDYVSMKAEIDWARTRRVRDEKDLMVFLLAA